MKFVAKIASVQLVRRAKRTKPYGLKRQANGLRNHSPARFTAGRPGRINEFD